MIKLLANIFGALSGVFGWAKQRSEAKNSPDVKAAAVAQTEAETQAKTAQAIAKKDLDEMRKELAE